MIGDITHRLREKYLIEDLRGEDIQNLVSYVKRFYPDEEPDVVTDVALSAGSLVNCFIQQYDADGSVRITSPEVHLVLDCGEFNVYTRLDGLGEVNGMPGIWREELKTSSRMDNYYIKGLRRGLQTGIALWLMEELMEEDVRGTIFTIIVKKTVPEVHMEPVPKSVRLIEIAKEVVYQEFEEIKRGHIFKSGQCQMYNRECSYAKLCNADTPANRKAFYTSRKLQKERSQMK